jgi:hypothetical protein
MKTINIISIYSDPDDLVEAIHKVKEKGIKIKNVFSPFPIHEVFEALGLKTRLPYLTFIYGVIGVALTFGFLYWTSVVNYPLKFGGKPLNSLSFIIIMFVATIFVATVLTFTTFFIRQKIGPGKKVVMLDPRTVDDKFAIVIEKSADLSDSDVANIKKVLADTGAEEVNEQEEPDGYFQEEND